MEQAKISALTLYVDVLAAMGCVTLGNSMPRHAHPAVSARAAGTQSASRK